MGKLFRKLISKIKSRISSLKIRHKILLFYFILIVFSIGLSILIYQQTSEHYMNQKMKEIAIQGIQSDSRSVEMLIDDINNYSKMLIANQNVQKILQEENENKKVNYKELDRFLSQFINFNPKVSSIYIFSNSGTKYYTEKQTVKSIQLENIKKMPWYEETINKKGGYIIRVNDLLTENEDDSFISFIRVINNINKLEPIGLLMINVSESVIKDALGLTKDNNTSVLIKNKYGQDVINYNNSDFIDEDELLNDLNSVDSFSYPLKNKKNIVMVTGLNNNIYGWKFLKVIPFENSSMYLQTFNFGLLGIILVNVILVALGSIFISKLITDPIHSLINSMKDVEKGEFQLVCINTNNDEIGMLKNVYNYMINEIQLLIKKIIHEQKIKRKAEFGIIMEQIKPHFLYNTLDSISSLIMLERNEEAYNSLSALGIFYRTSLSNGRDIITIKEEVETVKNYLYIQKIRYRDLFEVEYQIDEKTLDVKVPKLILQPLVENSIYHGLRPAGDNGKIILKTEKLQEKIYLIVEDTGVGMDKEQLESLDKDNNKRIGIHATKERIRILFGDNSKFTISSNRNEGTKVTIEIPIQKEDDYIE